MSRFIQVGVTAMRDPLTGEPMAAVPLYVDAEESGGNLPEINTADVARAFMRKLRAQENETTQSAAVS